MNLMIVVWVTFISIWESSVIAQDLVLKAAPSSKAVAGGYLELSCTILNQRFPIMWRKNGNDIAENCIMYKDNGFKCSKIKDTYHFIKSSVSWEDRGTWTCSHGPKTHQSIEIDVIVPALVHSLSLVPVKIKNAAPIQSIPIAGSVFAQSDALPRKSSLQHLGSGSRRDPIDLTGELASREILIECLTTCASITPHILWRSQNSTWTMTLQTQRENDVASLDLASANDVCLPGLHTIRERVRLSCVVGGSTPSANGLVGLNRVTCQPNHGADQTLVQTALLLGPQAPYHTAGQLSMPFDYAMDECIHKGKQLDACVYVLCPGQPFAWFTLGERVALAVSAGLFVLLIVLLCYLTRQRRRAKRKSNLAPGQRHEIELML